MVYQSVYIRSNQVLSKSDTPLPLIMKELATHGKAAGYLVPTDVGMEKSILDAHASLRTFLKESNIHDFEKQSQGKSHKRLIDVFLVGKDTLTPAKMSLYRPETKDGDPRAWIYGLKDHARSWNLLVLIEEKGTLYIVNASDREVFDSKNKSGSPLERLLRREPVVLDEIAAELLEKLNIISRMGWVDSLRRGDTGVGFTLETLLGIRANSRRAPDYRGIEIKSSRVSGSSAKVTLLSQKPDWEISKCKSGIEILLSYGYPDRITGRKRLSVTNCHTPNPQGLFLTINKSGDLLKSVHGTVESCKEVAAWRLEKLRSELEQKHTRTFWVKAERRRNPAGSEEFHYFEVEDTRTVLSTNFAPLIEIGIVTMDYTLSQKPSGKSKDHGYLFRMKPQNFELLFPPSAKFQLS